MAELDGSGLTNDWTFSDPYDKAPGMVAANFEPEVDYLKQVTVRLLSENEVGQFNYYLESEHYLESSRFAGQSLRYVAQVDGQWVALLTFSAPALHLKGRSGGLAGVRASGRGVCPWWLTTVVFWYSLSVSAIPIWLRAYWDWSCGV